MPTPRTLATTALADLEACLRELLQHWQTVGHQASVEATRDALGYAAEIRGCINDANGKDDSDPIP